MSDFKKKRGPYIEKGVFIIIGMLLMLVFFYFLGAHQINKDNDEINAKYSLNSSSKTDTVAIGNYTLHIKEHNEVYIKEQSQLVDEKFKSLNDRITDMYYSLGIIVTLIVFGLVSVYFRTESEVARHMDENYKRYKSDIESMNAEAQTMVSEIKSKTELAEQMLKKTTASEQSTPEIPNENNG